MIFVDSVYATKNVDTSSYNSNSDSKGGLPPDILALLSSAIPSANNNVDSHNQM